jgi:hypothetical protein
LTYCRWVRCLQSGNVLQRVCYIGRLLATSAVCCKAVSWWEMGCGQAATKRRDMGCLVDMSVRAAPVKMCSFSHHAPCAALPSGIIRANASRRQLWLGPGYKADVSAWISGAPPLWLLGVMHNWAGWGRAAAMRAAASKACCCQACCGQACCGQAYCSQAYRGKACCGQSCRGQACCRKVCYARRAAVGVLQPGVLRAGVLQPGVLRAGVLRACVLWPGMPRPGVLQPGVLCGVGQDAGGRSRRAASWACCK